MSAALKVAKANHKEALKNREKYKRKRDDLVRHMLGLPTPKWGNIKIILVKW